MTLNLSQLTADVAALHTLAVDSHARLVAQAVDLAKLQAAVTAVDMTAVQAQIDALDATVQSSIAVLSETAPVVAPEPVVTPVVPPVVAGGPTGVEVAPVAS